VPVVSGDYETAELILDTDHPRDQKALGRNVKNFNQDAWSEVSQQVVRQGNLAKVGYSVAIFWQSIGYRPVTPYAKNANDNESNYSSG